jgi:hypothetical protein
MPLGNMHHAIVTAACHYVEPLLTLFLYICAQEHTASCYYSLYTVYILRYSMYTALCHYVESHDVLHIFILSMYTTPLMTLCPAPFTIMHIASSRYE